MSNVREHVQKQYLGQLEQNFFKQKSTRGLRKRAQTHEFVLACFEDYLSETSQSPSRIFFEVQLTY